MVIESKSFVRLKENQHCQFSHFSMSTSVKAIKDAIRKTEKQINGLIILLLCLVIVDVVEILGRRHFVP